MEEAKIRVREVDDDLSGYLTCNRESFAEEHIANIHATVSGHNDDDNWYWIIELKDGSFRLTSAWCDYTGWDCSSGGNSQEAESAEAAALLAPEVEKYTRRHPRRNLLAQLRGEQPFGLEVS